MAKDPSEKSMVVTNEAFGRSKYQSLIEEHFEPDSTGISKWIEVIHLEKLGFKWTKNGNTRRGAPWGDHIYKWDFKRRNDSPKGEILALRTSGFSARNRVNSSIRGDIMEIVKNQRFCNFSLLPIPNHDKEVDHRYGFKEHPKYSRISDLTHQRVEDFQLLHHAQNVQKRQMCIECVESGLRPRHPLRDFVEGDETLDEITVCNGCFLAEPERYRD